MNREEYSWLSGLIRRSAAWHASARLWREEAKFYEKRLEAIKREHKECKTELELSRLRVQVLQNRVSFLEASKW